MTYVVVGAGPSGVVAAETLRKADAETEIVLIGEEPEPPYSRMAIPYYLTGKIDEAGTYLRKTDGHYDTKNITYQQGKVESVDAEAGKLNLHGGGSQDYDKLLICTGASPIKPPVEGLDQPGVHHCWTLEDARQIIGLAHEGADVVLIGAGFIACIILEALVERGVNLSVVEMEERMLPRMMDEIGGDMIKRWCVNKGVNVQTGRRVTKLDAAGGAGEDRQHACLNYFSGPGPGLRLESAAAVRRVQDRCRGRPGRRCFWHLILLCRPAAEALIRGGHLYQRPWRRRPVEGRAAPRGGDGGSICRLLYPASCTLRRRGPACPDQLDHRRSGNIRDPVVPRSPG